jgi:hypothetical protein
MKNAQRITQKTLETAMTMITNETCFSIIKGTEYLMLSCEQLEDRWGLERGDSIWRPHTCIFLQILPVSQSEDPFVSPQGYSTRTPPFTILFLLQFFSSIHYYYKGKSS